MAEASMSPVLNTRIFRNFLALTILQGGNYLLPLILIPFLIRSLGMSTFGDWVFAGSFVAIFRTFVNYGFDLTATRAVSVNRDDRNFVGQIYTTVVATRLVIFGLSCLTLFGLALLFESIWRIVLLAQLSMLVLIGEALFPIWLFQGMEQMSTITQLRLGYRALFVLCVILIVRDPQDVLLVPLIEGAASLVAGLIAMRLAFVRYGLAFHWPGRVFVETQLKEGASILVSYVAVHFYTTINTVLLGIVQGSVAVAQFSIAEKIYFAIRGMLGPVVQALFPMLSRLHEADRNAFNRVARTTALAFVAGLVSLALITCFMAEPLVQLIGGKPDQEATHVLQILAVALVFALGTLLSSLLVIQQRGNTLAIITFATMALNLIIIYPLLHSFGVIGMAIAFLITQIFQTIVQISANIAILSRKEMLNKTGP